jgi:hypothetical protein
MPQKDDSSVKLTPALEIDDSSNADISKIANRKNNLSSTEEQVALDESNENHDSQEDNNKFEKKKPQEEKISVAPSPKNSTKEEPIPPPKPTWTLTFLNVDEDQGDSVSVSHLDRDGNPISIAPTKKGQCWEFRIPTYISTIDVNWTKEGHSGWTSFPERRNNIYNFQEFVQMLLR